MPAGEAGSGGEPVHEAGTAPAPITVVIPVWGATYRGALPAAIASAAGPGRHVVVVTPAGEPEPPAAAAAGAEVLRAARPLSVGAARNLGLAAVRSPFVVFLDADDELVPGALESMVAALDAAPRAVAAICRVIDRESGAVVAPRRGVDALARHPRALAAAEAVWSLLPTQGCALIRTEAARACGGYADADGGEDWAFGVALAAAGPVVLLTEPGLSYAPARYPDHPVPRAEMRARARLARASRRRSTGPAGRLALPLIALCQLLIIELLRPLLSRCTAH